MHIPEGNRRLFTVFHVTTAIFILDILSIFFLRESAGGIITMSIPFIATLAGGYLTNDYLNKKKEAEVKQ
jgi:uncharacterized membrane protein YjjP (DUF1212 family)